MTIGDRSKMSRTMEVHIKKLASALKWASNEHGRPNSFGCDELHRLYGGPRAAIAGRIARSLIYKNVLYRELGGYQGWRSAPAYGKDTKRFYV
jgi:hypothetical protein